MLRNKTVEDTQIEEGEKNLFDCQYDFSSTQIELITFILTIGLWRRLFLCVCVIENRWQMRWLIPSSPFRQSRSFVRAFIRIEMTNTGYQRCLSVSFSVAVMKRGLCGFSREIPFRKLYGM